MLLRLWLALATGLGKPRIGLFDEAVLAFRVWPNDLDVNLHLTNSRYLRAMDLGRWDYGMRARLWLATARRRWFPLVGTATLRFRKGLAPFERYELRTRLVAWDEKWCWFEQRFAVGERDHAIARLKVLFRGPRGNVPTRELFAACGVSDPEPRPLPEWVRLWQQVEQAEATATRPGSDRSRPAAAPGGKASG
jgi:acyl-CoA thioesterase FadM